MTPCTLCHTPLINRIDEEFFSCPVCGGFVKHPALRSDPETEKEQYLEHNNDINDPRYQEFTSPISNFIKKNYSSKSKGLDFGSGTGPVITKVLRDDGFDIQTYDPFFAPDETVLQIRYDYIACCEVFEHFFNPYREIKLLKELLNPEGRLIIMTLLFPDDTDFEDWFYKKDPTHVFIYRRKTIQYIAAIFGFSIEQMDHRLIVLRKASVVKK